MESVLNGTGLSGFSLKMKELKNVSNSGVLTVHSLKLKGIVMKEGIEIGLKLRQILVPGLSALDTEVFIEHRAMEALEITVALRPADLGGAVLDAFELEEKFVGMPVRPVAELPAVIRDDGLHDDFLRIS